jgi:hypothetical protein
MTVTKAEAQRIALEYVKSQEAEAGCELELLEGSTWERDFGWVFFYDSKDHIRTGEFRYTILGNAPIVVTRADGLLHETGTAYPVERYLERFNKR